MAQGFRNAYGLLRRKAEAYDVLEAAMREIARSTRRSTINPHDIVPTGEAMLAKDALKRAGNHTAGTFDGRARELEELLRRILIAHDTKNCGAVNGEAILSQSFVNEARALGVKA